MKHARVLLFAGLLVLCASGCLGTTYGQHYGVVDQWGTDGSGTDPMSVIFTNLGAKWIRSGWDWDLIEGLGDNQYDPGYLALMDNWATTMHSLGVNIYYGFSYTPAWARPGGTGNNTPPTDPTRYTDFITFMVNRYKDRIKYWGLWNEPNIDGFWNGTDDNYIHNILIPGIAAVKAADPTAKVVVGELASCCNESSLLQTFLAEIAAHGKKDLVDIISVHGYGYGDTASGRIAHLDSLHNMIVSAGYGDRDFWCTETSWEGKGTTSGETTQANQIVGFMQGMDSRPWWKKTFYFTLSEGPGATQGLIRSDQSLKPAYTQYQTLIALRADDAEIVSDTIPSTMVAGRQYVASVTVRNTGTATWDYQYRLGAVDDSDPFAGGRQYLGESETVAPDATRTFWIPMTAPSTTGTYTTDWRMVHESVQWFGHPLTRQVTVSNGPDTTAPGPVTGFTATMGDMQTALAWTNPADADFSKTMIRYKTTGYPTGPTDGALLVDRANTPGTTDTYVHSGLTLGATYYYAAFAHDVVPNYSSSVTASALARDAIAPGQVTGFTATPGGWQVSFSWQNPADSDLVSTRVLCKIGGYPTGPTDGLIIYDKPAAPGSADSFTCSGFTNVTDYYFAAYARDEVPNYSTAAAAMATPIATREAISTSRFSADDDDWTVSLWQAGTYGPGSVVWSSNTGHPGGSMRFRGTGTTDGADRCTREGGEIRKTISTLGYGKIKLDYELRITGWGLAYTGYGAGTCPVDHDLIDEQLTVYYTIDGVNWTQADWLKRDALLAGYKTWGARTVDVSGIAMCEDNPSFALRLRWQLNASNDVTDLDNIVVTGSRIGKCPLSQLKALADGSAVYLDGRALYLKSSGFGYIEDADRTSGIRVDGAIGANVGDRVTVAGTLQTKPGGERFIQASGVTPTGSLAVAPLGLSNRGAANPIATGLYVTVWGMVKPGSITADSFVLTDGSDDAGIPVVCPGAPGVSDNEFVTVTGAAGFDGVRIIFRK